MGGRAEASLPGKVTVEGAGKFALNGVRVTLVAADGLAVMPAMAVADDTGAFSLAHVVPAAYDLAVSGLPEGTYLKRVEFNGKESLGKRIDCSAVASGTLRILLGTDGAGVEVHVSADSKPARDATVVLVPVDVEGRIPDRVQRGMSDAAGLMKFKDVPPGDYLALAWEEVEDNAWFDPAFVKSAESRGAKVSVGAKGAEKVDLDRIPVDKR